jgi:hypothetical protein
MTQHKVKTRRRDNAKQRSKLVEMHRTIKDVCYLNAATYKSEVYRLMCSLGASLGNKRTRRSTYATITERYHAVMARLEQGLDVQTWELPSTLTIREQQRRESR